MTQRLFFLILIFLPIFSSGASKVIYEFEKISPESGIIFNAITTIQTDKNGFLWFGSENGLYSYNGEYFQRYQYSFQDSLSIPSNKVNHLYKDSQDKLWICTENGCAYFEEDKDRFKRIAMKNLSSKASISIIEVKKSIYIILINQKLYTYNFDTDYLSVIPSQPDSISFLSQNIHGELIIGTKSGELFIGSYSTQFKYNRIYQRENARITTVCEDKDWYYIGYDNKGVDVINNQGEFLEKYSYQKEGKYHLPSNKIRKIIHRSNGEIWVGTYNGIAIISNDSTLTINKSKHNLPSNSIYDIYTDSNKNIWIGTWAGGLIFYNPNNYKFRKELTYPNSKRAIGVTSSFAATNDNQVWIGSEDGGITLFNTSQKQIIEHILTVPIHIKSMFYHEEHLWLGTVEDGLYYMSPNEKKIKSVYIQYLNEKKSIISSISGNNHILWIATRNSGIVEYDTKTKKTETYNIDNKKIQNNKIWQIYIDPHGDVYACTDDGLFIKKRAEDTFKRKNISLNNINKEYFYCICPKNYNEILIGSRNNGIFIYNSTTQELKEFENNELFKNIDIYTLTKDFKEQIWFSTNNGIYTYNQNTQQISHYTETDGLIGKQFHPLASILTKDGSIFFGSTNGFNYINTHDITNNSICPKAYPINIQINNKKIEFNNDIKTNSKHIPNINQMILKHHQNTLTFRFASNNLLKPQNNRLRYKLEGYQKNWIEIPQTENIVFTQIPHGKYILKVHGSNNDGVWSEETAKINIVIKPPYYLTTIAFFLYFVIVALICYFLLKIFYTRFKFKKEIEIEKYKNSVNKKATEERIKFFMNISHELRTPLNLINAPLKAMEEKYFDKDTLFHIRTIRRNTDRLLKLTEQILDFRLLEVNKLQSNKKRIEIVSLCKDTFNCFEYYILTKNIQFTFNSDCIERYIFVDSKKIEKVVYNLLSNALKYTNENGHIEIQIRKIELSETDYNDIYYIGKQFIGKSLEIRVADSGMGIAKENFERIFERFQTIHPDNQEGSGIGLHLCKEFVILHDGNIMLQSTINKGSIFTVHLPFSKETEEINSPVTATPFTYSTENDQIINYENLDTKNQHTILIIDDNEEVVYYLKRALSKHYKCVSAKNGKLGLELSIESNPDLIIMDILMPVIDGITCSKAIKSHVKTQHIPIILLSGAADSNSQCQGISVGADVFLSKPVDEQLLIKHIERLLHTNSSSLLAKESPIQSQNFLEMIDIIINSNLQKPNFDVNVLAEKVNMSRSSLFRRIKTETNLNISEYIKEQRLHKAVTLIKNGQNCIEEISIASGFNSASYFCKCFKAKYGKTPKEYIQSI